ncbi:MAG: hypothetical protein DMG10_23790 [Acidobacteria bacterium]|nr:MAG: hypothetical protein DMG10_23790 [Acidobacteriota bacterium]
MAQRPCPESLARENGGIIKKRASTATPHRRKARGRGAEGQRGKGAEGQRSRGAGGPRGRGTEGKKLRE